MSIAGGLLFYLCAAIATGTAVATVMSKNPLRAAMGLLFHIIALAGVYLTLKAQFLAAIQLLVYAGAVVVLFVFVIMLLGPESETKRDSKTIGVRTMSLSLVGMITFAAVFSLSRVDMPFSHVAFSDPEAEFGGVRGLGMVIYQQAVIPFELISVLLLVAIVGAVAMARGRTDAEREYLKKKRLEIEAAASATAQEGAAE